MTLKAFHNLALACCSPPAQPSPPCLTNAPASGFLTPGASAQAGPSVWSTLPRSCSQLGPPSSSEPLQMAQADTSVLSSLLPTHFAHPSIIRTTKAVARPYSAFGQSRKRHPSLQMLYFICWKTLRIGVPTHDIYNVQDVSPGGAHATPELPLWEHFHVPGTALGTLCQILFAKPRRKTIHLEGKESKG